MSTFRLLFGRDPEVHAEAPGRVNLIGEHTDYNGGYVLPAAIPQRTRVEAASREDRRARIWSAQRSDATLEYAVGSEQREGGWLDYVKGMTHVLSRFGEVRGFDMRIDSDVPVGSGLSSSAALEIAVGRALRDCFRLSIGDLDLARAGQRAENEMVGAPVGIMDQMAAVFADTRTALFVDTRTLGYSKVPLPDSAALVVIDSGIAHRNAASDYSRRRAECEQAARSLGVAELRDVGMADLDRVARLPEPLNRRARHIVTENQRVLDTVAALLRGDLAAVGGLFSQSHASMRDDFEISLPAIDRLVDIACNTQGVHGARLTGGGFGGAIAILADAQSANLAASQIIERYRDAGYSGRILVQPRTEDIDGKSR